MERIHNKSKKHSSRKLKRDYTKNSKNLFKILAEEISKGNFRLKGQTAEGYKEGFVYYKKRNYFIVYDPANDRVMKFLTERGYNKYRNHI